MPVPTVYSEAIFADYLLSVLEQLGDTLGWDTGNPRVQEAIADTLLEYGQSDISQITGATNMRHLRALGRRAIWRAVVQATSGRYDFSDSDARFSRSQIQQMARESLALAEHDCLEWDPLYAATIVSVKRVQDPYTVWPDSERTL